MHYISPYVPFTLCFTSLGSSEWTLAARWHLANSWSVGKTLVKQVGQELGHWYQNQMENCGTSISKIWRCPTLVILRVYEMIKIKISISWSCNQHHDWLQPHSELFADLARVDPRQRRILQPRREAAFLYDAVMLYAHSLAKVWNIALRSAELISLWKVGWRSRCRGNHATFCRNMFSLECRCRPEDC